MASALRTAPDLLKQYAEYHRYRRNIATHLVGVPLIVFGVGVLLARPEFTLVGQVTTPLWCVFALFTIWTLTRGVLALGAVTLLAVGALMWLAQGVSGGSTAQWLSWGLGAFVLGWIIQFIGHYYEGRKPAFVDDLTGLIVAPMFVTMEMLAPLGLFRGLMSDIENHAGPTVMRDLAHPV